MKNQQVIHLFISGKVQGVGFRHNTRKKARQLGISGWVRNLEDGRVEVQASGPEQAISEFMNFCKEGPATAYVKNLEQAEVTEKPEGNGFTVRPSK